MLRMELTPLSTDLAVAHKSMLEAVSYMFASTQNFISLAASFVNIVERIELQTKVLHEREVSIMKAEQLVQSQRKELAAKLVQLDEREIRLVEQERAHSDKEATWSETEKRKGENATQLPSLIHMCVGMILDEKRGKKRERKD
jgi:hypothetical protein